MDGIPINPVDVLVALVMLISALLAFSRGAVREILGVSAWVGAALVAVFAFPHARPYPRQWVAENWPDLDLGETLADAGTALVLFILALIVFTIVNQIISGYVQRSSMGALDRSIGFIFGLLRGAVLICLAYMLFVWAVKEPEDRPPWVEEAKTMPYIQMGTEIIREIAPEELRDKAKKSAADTKHNLKKLQDAERSLRALSEPTPDESGEDEDPQGYGNSERKAMDGLSDSVEE
ncbi:MAG: CvpA family protein [Rhodospirillaceae bacterium]|nr:CvpA family protein [Rhodospirillaceae bacterium]